MLLVGAEQGQTNRHPSYCGRPASATEMKKADVARNILSGSAPRRLTL